MRLVIVKDDNLVIVDGEGYTVDCSVLPVDFHALQWDGIGGEIEFRALSCTHCGVRSKKPNAPVVDIALYADIIAGWQTAKTVAEAARVETEAKLARERVRVDAASAGPQS